MKLIDILKMARKRLTTEERKEQIFEAFITVAKRRHYNAVKRSDVAFEAKISEALVTRYFDDSMFNLRQECVEYCIKNEILEIVAQCLIIDDLLTITVSRELKKQGVAFIAERL